MIASHALEALPNANLAGVKGIAGQRLEHHVIPLARLFVIHATVSHLIRFSGLDGLGNAFPILCSAIDAAERLAVEQVPIPVKDARHCFKNPPAKR